MDLISELSIDTIKYLSDYLINKSNLDVLAHFNFIKENIFSKNLIYKKVFENFILNPSNVSESSMFSICLEIEYQENSGLKRQIFELHQNIKYPKHEIQEQVVENNRLNGTILNENQFGELAETSSEDLFFEPETTNKTGKHGSIVVVWEFDKESTYSLQYAVNLAQKMETDIIISNFTKNIKDLEISKKLEDIANETKLKYGISVTQLLVDKSKDFSHAYEDISETPALIILGANSSSKLLNNLCNSPIAVMVVQAPPKASPIKTVLFPIDNRPETKMKLKIVKDLAKNLQLMYHISLPGKFMVDVTKQKTHNNLNFARSFFRQNNIEHETHTIESTKSFSDSTLIAAEKSKPDLMIILPTEKIGFGGVTLGSDEKQFLKQNPNIPVLFVSISHQHKISRSVFSQ